MACPAAFGDWGGGWAGRRSARLSVSDVEQTMQPSTCWIPFEVLREEEL